MGTLTASPGDGEHAAREGYYPDPSIPGYVRYWNGAAWVPGTSRPAASAAPASAPAAAFASASASPSPSPSASASASASASVSRVVPVDETGPVFLDETSATEALTGPGPDADPAGWQADPLHQAGFGGPRDVRVSWGGPAEPEPRPGGISLARPAPAPVPAAPAAPARQVPAQATAEGAGILSARPPAWPDAPGAGTSGLTSSWPEATASAPRPARVAPEAEPYGGWPPSAPSATAAPTAAPTAPPAPPAPAPPSTPSAFEPRDAGRSAGSAPAPGEAAPPAAPRPAPRSADGAPAATPTTPTTPSTPAPVPPAEATRAVFERMAEHAVRPAGLVRRILARALDSLVLAGVATAVALPLVPRATAHVQVKVDGARASGRTTTVWLLDGTITGYLGLVLAAVLVFGVFYEALPTARWGRTPGKKLFGVRVLAAATLRPPGFGAALRRWLVYALLGLPGSLWALLDRPRRRAWHDRAAGTYVAR
ncbi:RDD family protein [Streptomyces lavendulae]|uniref:RDD family protein n=1 Tax=Streptomyces lavendulae TaxID=1914 RepID=UPI0034011328